MPLMLQPRPLSRLEKRSPNNLNSVLRFVRSRTVRNLVSPLLHASVGVIFFLCGCGGQLLDEGLDPNEMVYFGTTARISGFDPIKSSDVASSMAIGKIYEGLYEYAYLERPHKVLPALAEDYPRVSADGLTYTIKIRSGIYFADDPCFEGGKGREVTAHDFVYSIKRNADLKLTPKGYWVFQKRIVGLDAFKDSTAGDQPTDYSAVVEGLQALDDSTLQIQLTAPYPQLMWILAMHYAFVVPREAVDYYKKELGRPEFVNHPVGTGPFVLKNWRRNYRVEFERNPKWKETGRVERYPTSGEPQDEAAGLLVDAGKEVPLLDRVIQYVVDDPSTEWLMFLSGQFPISGISRDNWDVVINDAMTLDENMSRRNISLIKTPRLSIGYIGFNMDDPVVGYGLDEEQRRRNRKIRQAMSCALNTEKWIQFNNSRIVRPNGPIPPGVAGYSDVPSPYGFDLEKAKQLLVEAGYPGGRDPETGKRLKLTLELRSATSPEVRQRAELFASFMDEIGIEINASYNNWPTFLDKMDRRQAQMFWLGWVADYPDAENFLQLFYGKNSSPGPNHANYVNPVFDELYDQIRPMQDSPERTALYKRMSDIVVEDCPWIFTSIPMSYILRHSWIENYKPHDFPYTMTKYYKINQEQRRDWIATYGDER